MTIKLYGVPGTRTNRVQWLLEELGLPYEYQQLSLRAGEHKSAAHLARHPHGVVPVLEDGSLRLIESGAMMLHLADKAGALAPSLGTEARARYYQFIVYTVVTLDTPVIEHFFHTVLLPQERRDAALAAKVKPVLEAGLSYLERELGAGPFLVGETFTAADVTVGYSLNLMSKAGLLVKGSPLADYFERLSARPAFVKVFQQ